MARKAITPVTQADVVIKSKRRCALCVGIDGNSDERPGQIAHLNGDNTDNRLENLVWLCLEHHDKFDSKTSQTKNYTQIEVTRYRDALYKSFEASAYTAEDVDLVRKYLNTYGSLFSYMSQEYDELAYKIDHNVMDSLAEIRDFWYTNPLRSFNSSVREAQDHIANNIVGILGVYEIQMYELVGNWIKYNNKDFPNSVLGEKKEQMRGFVDSIFVYYRQLEAIAVR